MTQNAIACIQANPDIAGIGVRISIYIQNVLGLLLALVYAWDGVITIEETKSFQSITTNLLLTACALLISTLIQAKSFGISLYHALIVLNLSWINSLTLILAAYFPTLHTHAFG